MTKLIPLEEVKFILSHWENLTYNANTQEEGMDILYNRVNELPTIDLSIIDDMIEEYTGTQTMTDPLIVCAFQELKSRLSLTQK